jgi:hypothetical protein
MLSKFALRHRDGASGGIEQDRARRGCALIDRQDMIRPHHEPTIEGAYPGRKGCCCQSIATEGLRTRTEPGSHPTSDERI